MIIRNLTIDDYESIYFIWQNSSGVGMRSLDDSKEGIERFINRNPKTSFILEVDGKICGVILCGHDGRRGYIYHTAVLKEFQNKGFGKILVNTSLNALKVENINKAALVVFKKNEEGNAFWQKLGFIKRDDLVYRNINLNEDNI